MEIELHEIKSVALQDFAKEHGLVMEIHERDPHMMYSPSSRYYAHFKSCEVKEGGGLLGVSGNGATPEEAMIEYMPRIEGRLLVFDAYRSSRREIRAPGKLHFERSRREAQP